MYAVESGRSTCADVRLQYYCLLALAELARQCRCFSPSALRTFRVTFRWSGLINQFVSPTFCLCFAFTGINFRGMLHHVL